MFIIHTTALLKMKGRGTVKTIRSAGIILIILSLPFTTTAIDLSLHRSQHLPVLKTVIIQPGSTAELSRRAFQFTKTQFLKEAEVQLFYNTSTGTLLIKFSVPVISAKRKFSANLVLHAQNNYYDYAIDHMIFDRKDFKGSYTFDGAGTDHNRGLSSNQKIKLQDEINILLNELIIKLKRVMAAQQDSLN